MCYLKRPFWRGLTHADSSLLKYGEFSLIGRSVYIFGQYRHVLVACEISHVVKFVKQDFSILITLLTSYNVTITVNGN